MYPLNMFRPSDSGFALANNEAEHESLSRHGYEPKFEGTAGEKTAPEGARFHTVHKGRGKYDVMDGDVTDPVASGLSKEEATAKAAELNAAEPQV